jgi:hypothetical protein
MRASLWNPAPDIVGPCADISFERLLAGELLITMHFSNVVGLPNKDLQLRFIDALAVRWEVECPGFETVPAELPKCAASEWNRWTFPLLTVEGSGFLEQFRPIYERDGAAKLGHFLLVSMNDLIQVVAPRSCVEAAWVPGRSQP